MHSEVQRLEFFPTFLPGETLFSAICRFRVAVYALKDGMRLLQGLGLRGNVQPLKNCCPSHVGSVASALPHHHLHSDPLRLAREHTAFPFMTYFFDRDARIEMYRKYTSPDRKGTIHTSLGLLVTQWSGKRRPPAYCIACVAEDLRRYELAYWHIEHQLPLSFVCHRHGLPLEYGCRQCGPMLDSPKALQLPFPCKAGPDHIPLHIPPPSGITQDELQMLARESAYIQAKPEGWPSGSWGDITKSILRITGHRRGQTLLRQHDCVEMLKAHFSIDLLRWAGALVGPNDAINPTFSSTLTSASQHGPLKCILLSLALRSTIKEYEQDCARALPGTADFAQIWNARWLERIKELSKSEPSIKRAAETLRVSRAVLRHDAGDIGVAFQEPNKQIDKATYNAICCLAQQKKTISQIAYALKVSQRSILSALTSRSPRLAQLLQRREVRFKRKLYRRRIAALHREHPEMNRTELCGSDKHAYLWLRDNDGEWLSHLPIPRGNHLGRQPVVATIADDERFATALFEAAKGIRARELKSRITKGRLVAVAQVPGGLLSSGRLPRSAAMLESLCESGAQRAERLVLNAIAVIGKRSGVVGRVDIHASVKAYWTTDLERLCVSRCAELGYTWIRTRGWGG